MIKNWFLGFAFIISDKGKFKYDYWFQLMPLVIELKWCEELHLCKFFVYAVKNNEENILKPLIYTKFTVLRNLTLGIFNIIVQTIT